MRSCAFEAIVKILANETVTRTR